MEIETPARPSPLERARAGDVEAFNEVYRAHATPLLRQAMALCGNAAQAEELAQDTLVEAWKSLRRYNGRCQFFTWLCAILLNRHRNCVRKNRALTVSTFASHEQDEAAEALANLTDQHFLPDEATALREQAAQVRRCIETLPVKHQQVIFLRFYVDNSLEGIAEALGCSVGTVKSRLFHALDKLRGMNAMNAQFAEQQSKTSNLVRKI